MIMIHGTVVEIAGAGVLLRGPSGSGKSALALRLIDMPGFGIGQEVLRARLVADDQIVIERTAKGLIARPPENLAGLLEIRGLGIVKIAHIAQVQLTLVVDLAPAPSIARMPEPYEVVTEIEAVTLRRMVLDGADAAAPAKIRANLL